MKQIPGLVALFVALAFSSDATAERPNLVLIIADDCTYLDLGVYGGQAKTPNLDRLAQQGMQFSRVFQAAPMCSPTRHNIYTGIYPVKSGAWPNHTQVYPGTKSIAHYLQGAGYRVALSGKVHVAPKESFPFEYSKGFGEKGPNQPTICAEMEQLLVESKTAGTPFCLIACSHEPHEPHNKGDASAYPPGKLTLPPTFVDTPPTRDEYSRYLAEITYFDAQCGVLLDALERHGLVENTLVMVISEQGSSFPFAKWTCYEMGLASGMIARWPGRIQAGRRSDALVEYVDITPTFLDAVGLKTPATMDGQSFLAVLTGERTEHKQYTFGIQTTRGIAHGSKNYAVRSAATKTHRYIRNLNYTEVFKNNVTEIDAYWKTWVDEVRSGNLHAKEMTERYQHRPAEELYDVTIDPHCLNNLADRPGFGAIKADLSAQLDAWMVSQGDQGVDTEGLSLTRKAKVGANEKPED
jgi:N-sulfoglucosamine sulfohydrolase